MQDGADTSRRHVRFRKGLAVAVFLAVVWCLLVLLVLDPRATVSSDLVALYEPGWRSAVFVVLVALLLAGVGAAAWVLAVALVRAADDDGRAAPGRRRLGRVAAGLGASGAPGAATAVLGFPVGLGVCSRAETLGIAPPTASTSTVMAVTSGLGLAALGIGVVLAVVGSAARSLPSAPSGRALRDPRRTRGERDEHA